MCCVAQEVVSHREYIDRKTKLIFTPMLLTQIQPNLLQRCPQTRQIYISESYQPILRYEQTKFRNNFFIFFFLCRVSNAKNKHLQINLLTAVTCWTNSHLNKAALAVNSVGSWRHKSIKMCTNHDITSCNSWKQ